MSKGGSRSSSRQVKSSANKKVAKKGKGGQVSDETSSQAAVVTVDPFMLQKPATITDYYAPPALDENIKLENLENNLLCRWKLGSKGICSKGFESPDELIEHLLNIHSRCGTRGYVCCWESCSKRSVTHYNTRTEFQDHLKFHTVISPHPEGDDGNLDNGDNTSSDENYDDAKDDGSTDSDYVDSSDEEFTLSKRKRMKSSQHKTKSKRIRSDSAESAKTTKVKSVTKITPSISLTTKTTTDLTPVALSFYRFTCMWVVRFTMKGKNSTQEQNVICHRKFTIIEESIEHLRGHHVCRLKEMKEPLKCLWKGCALDDKVFASSDELNEHVLVHTEEKMLTFNSNVTLNDGTSKKNNLFQLTPVAAIAKKNTSASRKSKSPEKTSTTVVKNKNDSVLTDTENSSWMMSVLRALLPTQLKTDAKLCQASQHCLYCRFCSMKNRLSRSDCSTPYSMYEFTFLKDRFKACIGKPVSFFHQLLDELILHEDIFHAQKSIKKSFWVKNIKEDTQTCNKHSMNQNIVNLFPVQYKSCYDCTKLSESWPTPSHCSLVIELDYLSLTRYPDVLMVKGRVYQLSSVVCGENSNTFFTYVKKKNMWISYLKNSSKMADASQVFSDKGACILIYTEKSSVLSESQSNHKFQVYEYEECQKQSLNGVYSVQNNMCDNAVAKSSPQELRSSLVKKKDDEFVALFRCRKLINDGNESCINAVLQALLQTGLAAVVKKLCNSSDRCYFCRMLSFTQRAICSPEGNPIKPFELVLHKEELNVTEEEGNPGVYISDLVEEIVSDERAHHFSGDVKNIFVIRMKKKDCSCMNTCEAYHWAVSPTKRNESLLCLMAECAMQCTQCNVMTTVMPVAMPDNLIVTIEKNENNTETSVHYPDEWASSSNRYFLTSVIVFDPSFGKGKDHYLTYCKVFGKWMCYNDEVASMASSSDVLGNKWACVLIYVTKELTPQLLQTALADARCYTYKKRDTKKNSTLKVKLEPLDNY